MATATRAPPSDLHRPGRLADPGMDLRADPRMDPRLLAAMAEFGLDAAAPPPPVRRRDLSPEQVIDIVRSQDEAFEGLYAALPNDPPDDDRTTHRIETIEGVDGNDIALHIYRRAGAVEPAPCIVYVHGGGMTILQAYNNVHRRWCEDLAAAGLVVVAVDFRNTYGPDGLHPFPPGLDDCASATDWVDAHRAELGVTRVVLQGESGGGNLVLATALKAKRDGRLDGIDGIDGVYGCVPFVSGGYGWSDARRVEELPSLDGCDGYFINCAASDMLGGIYDPADENAENPLCWSYFASDDDLSGLPPHVITVNELDPLRDEGLAYHRALLRADVPAVGRINLGLTHAAELIFPHAVPEARATAIADIARFATSL